MIGLSGMSAVASLAGVRAISENSDEPGLQSKKLKIIVVGAHPGDPECGCGGTIACCMAHTSQYPEDWYVKIQKTIQRFRGIELNCENAEAFVRHSQNPHKFIS